MPQGQVRRKKHFAQTFSLRKVVKQTSGQTTKRFINGGDLVAFRCRRLLSQLQNARIIRGLFGVCAPAPEPFGRYRQTAPTQAKTPLQVMRIAQLAQRILLYAKATSGPLADLAFVLLSIGGSCAKNESEDLCVNDVCLGNVRLCGGSRAH